jgi:hypothetical protein
MKEPLVPILITAVLLAVLLVFASLIQAADIDIPSPPGIYAEATIGIEGGVLRWNTQAVSIGSAYILEGDCALDYVTVGVHGQQVNVGASCNGLGFIHLTTTGQLTSTCPYDGGTLEGLRLTLSLDGVVFYNEELWPNPITCWITPANPASVTWDNPNLTFDNSGQARPSAETLFSITDPAWLYSQHTFLVPEGVACSAVRKNIGTRFRQKYIEVGFMCKGTVPANAISTVVIQ